MAKNQSEMSIEEIGVDIQNLAFSETWMMILGRMFSNFLTDENTSLYEEVKCYNCSTERTGNHCPFRKSGIEAFQTRPFQKPVNLYPTFPSFPHGIQGSILAEKAYTDRGTLRDSMPVEFSSPAISVDWVKDDTPQNTLGNYLDNIIEQRTFKDPVDGSPVPRDVVIGKLYAQDVEAEVQIDFWEYNPLTLELMSKLFRKFFIRKKNFTQCRLTSKWRNVQLRSNGHFKEEGSGEPLKRLSYKVEYTFEELEACMNDGTSIIESISSSVDNAINEENYVNNNLRG